MIASAARSALLALLIVSSAYLLSARGAAAGWSHVAQMPPVPGWAWAIGLVAGLAGLKARGPWATPTPLSVALVLVLLAGFGFGLGRHVGLFAAAAALGLLASDLLPRPPRMRVPDRGLALALFVVTALVMSIHGLHRHLSFGSGSWDMGCNVHNAYVLSRGLTPVSTVLGDVAIFGDHFFPAWLVYAPVFWLDGSGSTLIVIQALNLACTAPVVFLIARGRGASSLVAAVLGLMSGLSFGLQSGAFFDAHTLTMGMGFLAWGLWAIEMRRWWLATVMLVMFSGFKESLGLYVFALGVYVVVSELTAGRKDLRAVAFGAAWAVYGAAWFVLVIRVLMPMQAQLGTPPVSHETYQEFGPSVTEAAFGVMSRPLTAMWFMFSSEPKLASIIVTFAGVGWLCLGSPLTLFVAGAPLFAERFLSSKASMWEMGYHYAAPLSVYAAWAAARAVPRAERWFSPVAVSVFLALSAVGTLQYGYKHPSNFLVWEYGYYARAGDAETQRRAIARLREVAGPEGRIAAQNRLLPHVAFRQHIWRLGEHDKADWVLLAEGRDAWPYDARYPARLRRQLLAAGTWTEAFAEDGVVILGRTSSLGPK